MRILLPQRKVKSQIRFLGVAGGVFFLTIIICSIFFVASSVWGFRIISPLTTSVGKESADQFVALLKEKCQLLHVVCNQVVILPDGSVQFTFNDGPVVFLSVTKDLNTQLASLQAIASQLTIKGKVLHAIDLRFDHVVVSF